MTNILFICHGNICRSTMAEFVMKYLVKKNHVDSQFYIYSAATSREEIGNPVHYGTRRILNNLGIDCSKKRSRQIRQKDFDDFDYISCRCAIVTKRIRIASETKVYKLSRDTITLNLLSHLLNNVFSRLYASVKIFSHLMQYIRRETVITFVRAARVNVYGIIAIFFCFSSWYVYRLHPSLLSASAASASSRVRKTVLP
jgi:protein-tyrosine-phosphatase